MPDKDLTGFDQFRMLEALSLAEKGAGYVSPNPMVGAIVVKDGKVIGRGYHKRFGGPHAEVYAIQQAGKNARGGTLYVNLEPCCHVGKTPRCTDLIVKVGIKCVVVGMRDPNPVVNGKGLRILETSGIMVVTGVLERECKKLNEAFVKSITTGLPFVTLKIAQTLDGKIADSKGNSRWITNEQSRRIVHVLRSRIDAVLVGANTVLSDNPRLTVRSVRGRNPLRVVLDGNLRVISTLRLFRDSERRRTWLFTTARAAKRKGRLIDQLTRQGIHCVVLDAEKGNTLNLRSVLKILAVQGVTSVMVEGGSRLFSQFIEQGLADKCIFFISPQILGEGLPAFQFSAKKKLSEMPFKEISSWNIEGDLLVEAYVAHNKDLQKRKKII